MASQTEVIDAVNAAATSFGMDGTELEQLLGYVASMPADEYRDFTSPGVQDPKAILELVRSRFKAQGRIISVCGAVKPFGSCWPWW